MQEALALTLGVTQPAISSRLIEIKEITFYMYREMLYVDVPHVKCYLQVLNEKVLFHRVLTGDENEYIYEKELMC